MEIKKTIPFAIASTGMNYLGINLIQEVEDLHSENYKNTEETNWRNYKLLKSYIMIMDRKNNTVKMLILAETTCRVNEVLVKIQMAFFTELDKTS